MNIIWLEDVRAYQGHQVGNKSARLAELMRRGFLVPPGFCITTTAYDRERESSAPSAGQNTLRLSPAFLAELQSALERLTRVHGASTFAVRSSSPAEDGGTASYAGQYSTFLNVPAAGVPAQVAAVWASALAEDVVAYRGQAGAGAPGMAVLVQLVVPCRAAGVAFSRDPLSGRPVTIIEGAAGLGESVVGGYAAPHRYLLEPGQANPGDNLLSRAELEELGRAVQGIEQAFGCPQDVEWGVWQDRVWILQARPITTSGDDLFTEASPADTLWTSGFFNERFAGPVSPLGWSLLKAPIEEFAFRQPLRYMGVPDAETWPLCRLYRGHPYANARIFHTFYKPFPDALLPEDALRFFVHRDAGARRKVPYPRSILQARFLFSMLRHFVRDARNWSPLHNAGLWQAFAAQYDRQMVDVRAKLASADVDGLRALVAQIEQANARLLAIHRWSLTNADIFYSLLRRLLRSWLGEAAGARCATALTAGDGNLSLEANAALARLQQMAAALPLCEALAQGAEREGIGQTAQGIAFVAALDDVLALYGHRSPALDIYHPPLADDPAFLPGLLRSAPPPCRPAPHPGARAQPELAKLAWPRRQLVLWLAGHTRRYLRLREDQRFHWQKGLALLRAIYLRLAGELVRRGALAQRDDVFFLTAAEVDSLLDNGPLPGAEKVQRRKAIFERLQREWLAAPSLSYPAFVQGNEPIVLAAAEGSVLHGLGVSPGVGQGPVYVLLSAQHLAAAPAGSILVAPSIDPAWTPVLPRLAGLVVENGGQLSHGAVVAREYGLPAVAGIPGATGLLRNGELVAIDGNAGTVVRGQTTACR